MSDIEDIIGDDRVVHDIVDYLKLKNITFKGKRDKDVPEKDRKVLDIYTRYIVDNKPKNPKDFELLMKKAQNKKVAGKNFSKRQILKHYNELVNQGAYEHDKVLSNLMIKKITRQASGVVVITVLTGPFPSYTNKNGVRVKKPFSCGQDCFYCPNEPEMTIFCQPTEIIDNGETFSVKVKTEDDIDDIKVITYVTFDEPKSSKEIESDTEQKIYIINSKNFNVKEKTFVLNIRKKYHKFFDLEKRFYATKIEQPRSYISDEPAVLRANASNFDAVNQMFDRAVSLKKSGHEITKLEILVLGGTWSHYPREYQREFVRDIYYAANIFYDCWNNFTSVEEWNDVKDIYQRPRKDLESEIKINESCHSRIIGLTLETRPDCINKGEIKLLRQYGCTRVQLGIQHIDDEILEYVNRGCYTKDTIKAFLLLKSNGFKVDTHYMPDLPGSSPQKDVKMFGKILGIKNQTKEVISYDMDITYSQESLKLLRISRWIFIALFAMTFEWILLILVLATFIIEYKSSLSEKTKKIEYYIQNYDLVSPDLQSDQWKIYPTEVVKHTQIKKWFDEGSYKPYAENINPDTGNPMMEDVIMDCLEQIFPWIRVNRVIRDIPIGDIFGGNMNPNCRETVREKMKKNGKVCMDIRSREVKDRVVNPKNVKLTIRRYNDNNADEYFISFESYDEAIIYGFCRLRLNHNNDNVFFEDLKDSAIVRELHVYGLMVPQNSKSSQTQHFGFGGKLMQTAENISRIYGFKKIAVISGIGVRKYYENKRKFHLGGEGGYMIKEF